MRRCDHGQPVRQPQVLTLAQGLQVCRERLGFYTQTPAARCHRLDRLFVAVGQDQGRTLFRESRRGGLAQPASCASNKRSLASKIERPLSRLTQGGPLPRG